MMKAACAFLAAKGFKGQIHCKYKLVQIMLEPNCSLAGYK